MSEWERFRCRKKTLKKIKLYALFTKTVYILCLHWKRVKTEC